MSHPIRTGESEAPGATLNERQREAMLYLDGPCLVLAGAGSGKTRVITQKIAYLIQQCGYEARRVVALTFTNKAATEMLERLHALVPRKQAKGLTISTFHALGLRFLREEGPLIGLKPQFSVLDATDALAILQELLATTDKGVLRSVQSTISLWKNALRGPNDVRDAAATPAEVAAAAVYQRYLDTLAAYQAVDFDDLIRLPVQLLSTQDEVRERWQRRVHYLLVDEYQDTNACQYQLMRLLVGDRARFTVVGDDDQAIYAWRGATVENLAQLGTDYPELKVIKLEQNYRSVQRILHAANHVIRQNKSLYEKTLWSEHGMGEPIQVTPMEDDEKEAESIAMYLSAARFDRRAEWRDFAVLYRSNHQARILEQALRNLRIPYTISGGQSFFDKAEIRDVLAYLRLIANDSDDPAFIRAATTPRRGIGQATLATLGQYAAERQQSLFEAAFDVAQTGRLAPRQYEPLQVFVHFIQRMQGRAEEASLPRAVSDEPVEGADGEREEGAGAVLEELLRAIEYERHLYETLDDRQAQTRWQHVRELVDWLSRKAAEEGMSLLALTQHALLVSMLDRAGDQAPDAVKLSTLHAAKGLEFPHVVLAGVEEGLLPHGGREDEQPSGEAAAEAIAARIQEERRLMYVGITRAQRTLRLTWCQKRKRGRDTIVREPSRFIAEMGLEGQAPVAGEADAPSSPRERLDRLKALLKRA